MDPITFRSIEEDSDGNPGDLVLGGPFTPKLKRMHAFIRRRFNFVDRIAVAVFDSYSNRLKTFVSSNEKDDPLERYEFPLYQARSLLETIVKGPRVINDLSVFSDSQQEHTIRIIEHGLQSSYTIPIYIDQAFEGFIFLNSYQKNCFSDEVVRDLDAYCHMILSSVALDIGRMKILDGALKMAAAFLNSKHPQTAARMARMSNLTRLIAGELVAAGKCKYDEETIERLSRFAALHDIGKMAVPDSILLKPDRLTSGEFAIVAIHPERGAEMIDGIIASFGLQDLPGIEMLRNIVLYHHEKIDGSGYPFHLKGPEIPMEARIATVADIYDALTSDRPHRTPLNSEDAFRSIRKKAETLDPDCLAALERCKSRL